MDISEMTIDVDLAPKCFVTVLALEALKRLAKRIAHQVGPTLH
jgi:hypothetical protein